MKSFSILARTLALSCVLFATTAFEGYENAESNIDAFCTKEWTKRGKLNSDGYYYCLNEENQSLESIVYNKKKYENLGWILKAEQAFKIEWTKRGVTNYGMVDYSLREEIDAYLDVDYGLTDGNFTQTEVEICLRKWSNEYLNWSMTRYCLTEE